MEKEPKLTDKQRMFCEEYMIDFNATKAAIRSGYSQKTAQEIGAQNLSKLIIQNYISEKIKNQSKRLEISSDRVILEIARLAFVDVRKIFDSEGKLKDITTIDDDTSAAISSFEVDDLKAYNEESDSYGKIGEAKKIKLYDKIRALEMLAKHFGMFEKDNSQKPTSTNIINLGSGIKPPDETTD